MVSYTACYIDIVWPGFHYLSNIQESDYSIGSRKLHNWLLYDSIFQYW